MGLFTAGGNVVVGSNGIKGLVFWADGSFVVGSIGFKGLLNDVVGNDC